MLTGAVWIVLRMCGDFLLSFAIHMFSLSLCHVGKTKIILLGFCLSFAEAAAVGGDKLCSVERRNSFEQRLDCTVSALCLTCLEHFGKGNRLWVTPASPQRHGVDCRTAHFRGSCCCL